LGGPFFFNNPGAPPKPPNWGGKKPPLSPSGEKKKETLSRGCCFSLRTPKKIPPPRKIGDIPHIVWDTKFAGENIFFRATTPKQFNISPPENEKFSRELGSAKNFPPLCVGNHPKPPKFCGRGPPKREKFPKGENYQSPGFFPSEATLIPAKPGNFALL